MTVEIAVQDVEGARIALEEGADRIELCPVGREGTLIRYALDYTPTTPGSYDVAIRVYPKNALLPHRMDFALVKWA